ncbi:hypothetical protein QQ020_04015 [Fulvivirgaceae bacterium BMA12]|uniref:Uncharacterized protein n=1 Tax=Agaribacillus aureus TaxID=3051825 RepID=A0ABT8L2E5_9BACT|nr:hypothetical protein [Fulvivirgaceae bacterium BMA12]
MANWYHSYGFFIELLLVALAETWMIYYVFQKTDKILFQAIAPMRWLFFVAIALRYESFSWALLSLVILMAAAYAIINPALINVLVLGKPALNQGNDGEIGKLLHQWFPNKTNLWAALFKLILLAASFYLYFVIVI